LTTTVFLTTTGDNQRTPTSADDHLRLSESAVHAAKFGVVLTDQPESADIILFVGACESDCWDVRKHPLLRSYPERCFLYYSEDHIYPFVPGVYPSLREKINFLGRSAPGAYSSVLHIDIPDLPLEADCRYLFSFRGSFATHPSRRQLEQLVGAPRSLIEDLSRPDMRAADQSLHAPGEHRRQFVELLRNSAFALCPRGRSPSSWRLFETMKAGRVPVIIADEWMAPECTIPWNEFSIRIAEDHVSRIPGILEEREGDAPQMARTARRAYDENFSMETLFHRIIVQCQQLQAERRIPERWGRYLAWTGLIRPSECRKFLLPRLKRTAQKLLNQNG